MDHYILDENDCPRLVDYNSYYAWHSKLPEEIRSPIGFRLDRTEFKSTIVSTVFLGLDHSHDGGYPVLWETMVFCDDAEYHQYAERSKTRREALETHERFCHQYIGQSKRA